MERDFAAALGRALERTRAGDPAEATRIIRSALAGGAAPSAEARHDRTPARHDVGPVEDAEIVGPRHPTARGAQTGARRPAKGALRRPLRENVHAIRRSLDAWQTAREHGRHAAAPVIPAGARWETRTFAGTAGTRQYAVYVPATLPDRPAGLVLMLHGCTQTAEDFANGTRMNDLAERNGLIVAYPEQTRSDNAQACWNWFRPADQAAGDGEPEILAGIARTLCSEFGVPPGRCFAAGLSAGGAMAAILGASHPEVFGAVGVHSGLARGAAHDVVSAFAAMRGENGAAVRGEGRPVRTIVFHGSADRVVHPLNGDRVILAAAAGRTVSLTRESGRSRGGRTFTRTIVTGGNGEAHCEHWRIEDAGHAWSGGSADGSHTDPDGPDASAEMVRFFLCGAGGDA